MLQAAINARDWELAETLVSRALIAAPDDPDLLTEVAKVNAFRGRKRDAALMLVDAAKLAEYEPASRVDFAVRALAEVGEIYAAVDLLEQSLQQHPERDNERKILVGFLGEIQRTEKIGPHLKELIKHRAFDLNLLMATSDTSTRRLSEQTASRLLDRHPDDRRVRLSEAFLLMYRHDAAGAIKVLEDILEHHPKFASAHAMYGQALTLAQRWKDLPDWIQAAPPNSADYANYWLTLGDVSIENGEPAEAVNAYWEATRRDPNNSSAWDRLRTAILRLRGSDSDFRQSISDEQLATITAHAAALFSFRERFNDFAGDGKVSQTLATEIARQLMVLGRLWEAEAWSAIATTLSTDPSADLAGLRDEILARLRSQPNWIAQDIPAMELSLSFLPKPKLNVERISSKKSQVVPKVVSHEHLQLAERSASWGLRGVGGGNNPSDARLAALIRSTGAGGGTLDYDLDGLADLIIMNAGGTMLNQDSQPNQLMRNIGQQFIEHGVRAGVNDRSYGQGVAVGDFNEDGFPDLFFANLGTNRLFRNNGDGTFSDCSEILHDQAKPRWSTSGSFVDMNRDGISDLLVTNYCKTVENLDKACPKEGKLGPCHPLTFPAERDQFFAATRDSEFVDVTNQWIPPSSPGRGLGIVSGALDGSSLGIFVANDMSRNSFYSVAAEDDMKLVDAAAARGVAVDGLTRAQASMGIACSDFDLDGDLDFYVTGFAREYNVYYEQISPGTWKDETGRLGLIEPTLSLIGFGTEAIDLDSDGIDEIVVTNGHIGDFDEPDAPPYELPFQLFRRGAEGGFELVEDDGWGSYFKTSHVGRALWTTDVNRDGRNDFLISHSDEQVRLILNETKDNHSRIAFRLVATRDSRDAVGAVIRFQCNGQSRTIWRTSGDGYFCSNEKTLLAGLGKADKITNLTVTWQDGSVDQIGSLPANRIYQLTQGSAEAFELHHYGAR